MSGLWLAVSIAVPFGLGLLAAWPIWLTGQPILGNVAGAIVIFGAAVALILREHAELDRLVQACLDLGTTCWPTPAPFTRFAIYAFIALAQVIALFLISLSVETHLRRKGYAAQWR
jgi:hypothetical protein